MENWKDIPGYENLYQVSDTGKVKALERNREYKTHSQKSKERILRPSDNGKGYLQVVLYLNKKPKTFKVHKLVALAWIPNPHNLPMINHINKQTKDNNLGNLEWCTNQENIVHGNNLEYVLSKDGVTIYTQNLKSFCFEHDVQVSNMRKVLEGKRNHAGGWFCTRG